MLARMMAVTIIYRSEALAWFGTGTARDFAYMRLVMAVVMFPRTSQLLEIHGGLGTYLSTDGVVISIRQVGQGRAVKEAETTTVFVSSASTESCIDDESTSVSSKSCSITPVSSVTFINSWGVTEILVDDIASWLP